MYPKRTFAAFLAIMMTLGGSTVFGNFFTSQTPQGTIAPHRVELHTNMRGQTLEMHYVSESDLSRVSAELERQFEPFDIWSCIETSPGNCYMSGSNVTVYLPD